MPIGILMFVLPIVFAIGSAVFNTILCVIVIGIYNLVARIVGGLEFDFHSMEGFQQVPGTKPVASSTPTATYTPRQPYQQPPPPPPPDTTPPPPPPPPDPDNEHPT